MLRQLRRQSGLPQRALLEPLHLASHSAIVDYESGRRLPAPDIVAAYERFFALPRGQLQRLRSQALASRAAREARATLAAAPTQAAVTEPRLLPAAAGQLLGRVGDLAALGPPAAAGADPSAVVILVLGGAGGIGKAAMAVHCGQRSRLRFPDGELYVDLRGFQATEVPMSASDALGLLLQALGTVSRRIPPSVAERCGLYRSLLATRRALIVLDNAADAEQVRPLLPGAPGCVVVVTSRHRLVGLAAGDGAPRILLDVLTEEEAIDLLCSTIGPGRPPRPGAIQG